MKKQSILFLLCTLTAVLFYSCAPKTVKTKEKDLTQKFYLTTDTTKGNLNVDIQVAFPVAYANKEVLDSIRATIITNLFGEKYVAHSNDSIVQLFASELEIEYKANNEPLVNVLDDESQYSFNNEHILEGFTLLSDQNIFSYGIDRYVFMGGAHGLSNRTYFNFDLKTGKIINEKDLFTDNYQLVLSELIKKHIKEEQKEPIADLEETIFWTDSIKPNGNFYITDESINYVFNPYEIAPYYVGQTEINLPFEQIKNLLKPNNPIAYLVQKQSKKQ